MSYITRRGLSALVPPKIASPSVVSGAPNAARIQRIASFYEKLPRGRAPKAEPKGLIARYQYRHFGDEPSAKPYIHFIVAIMALGYAQNYYFHLRHHKNNAH